MKVDALILAGGGTQETIEGQKLKGFLEIKGKILLDYILETLKESSSIEETVVVTPAVSALSSWEKAGVKVAPGDGSIVKNIERGLNHLSKTKPVLTLSSDIPLITSEALEDFLNRCKNKKADFYYPIISKKRTQEKFPGTKRTYATLKEGTFTGGNLVLLEPNIVRENAALVEKIYKIRKSPFLLGKALGLKFVLKFLLKRLSLEEIEERVSSLIKAKGIAIITPYPEIGIDIDKESDLNLVRKILNTDYH